MKNILIVLLTVATVVLAITSMVLLKTSETAIKQAVERESHIHTLLTLNAKLEAASDVCLDLMELTINRRSSLLQEVHSDRGNDQVRSRPGRSHKGSARSRGARYAAFP